MKILVGILHSGEKEYEKCLESINRQTRVDFDTYTISGKRNAEAHDLLYGHFMESSKDYGIMVKIDADMVIRVDNLFEMIRNEFLRTENMDRLFIPVLDHFVLENLGGINAYRNTVTWGKNTGLFFTDMVHHPHSIRDTVKWDVPIENSLVDHCPDPSPFQSFHFGFHRTMKAFQPGSRIWHTRIKKKHWNSIRRMYQLGLEDHLLMENLHSAESESNRRPHLPRLYALAGSECALSGSYQGEQISRTDPSVRAAFERIDHVIRKGAAIQDLTPHLQTALNRRPPMDYWYEFLRFRLTT